MTAEQDLRACQIFFISRSTKKQYEKVFEVVQGSSVLTVGETPDFIDAGGAVRLSFELETLHFCEYRIRRLSLEADPAVARLNA